MNIKLMTCAVVFSFSMVVTAGTPEENLSVWLRADKGVVTNAAGQVVSSATVLSLRCPVDGVWASTSAGRVRRDPFSFYVNWRVGYVFKR